MRARSTQDNAIAYFSMEIGIDPNVPMYSGGLGILAGDFIRTAADLSVPFVGVSLLTRKGYFHQHLGRDGGQVARPESWRVEDHLTECRPRIVLVLEGRRITVRAWRYDVRGMTGTVTPIYYLDTDLAGNSPEDQALSHYLYGGDDRYRLCQEWVLGAGGVKMLRALGYRDIRRFHMNEGHAAFLTFELLAEGLAGSNGGRIRKIDMEAVRRQCVFTTHTPVPAGHDRFPVGLARQVLGQHPAWTLQRHFCREKGVLNMTYLALAFSRYVNGVSERHGQVSQEMFQAYRIDAITNGVHAPTWTAKPVGDLLDEHIPSWRRDNDRLRYAVDLPRAALWTAHQRCKARLIRYVNRRGGVQFDPKVFTIGFARRATAYKRADLLMSDPKRLQAIVSGKGRVQIVFAGKAHPKDEGGRQMIRHVVEAAVRLRGAVPIVYLQNYDMALAKVIIPGVDLWLNTPEPPLEASGTSGMKAALNGVPSLSIMDGWWVEGCIEGLTGWAIGGWPGSKANGPGRRRDATAMYRKLSHVVEMYYQDRQAYLRVMVHALALNGSYFNTQRMIEEYLLKAYLP